jgi:hypothetical protein
MSDLLATAEDLRGLLDEDAQGISDSKAAIVLKLATGAVQGAARQDLVLRLGDSVRLMGTTESWFTLPQRPVSAVTSVAVEGVIVTDYKWFDSRLWRRCGWGAARSDEPSVVEVTYSHGYEDTDPKLQFAQSIALALAVRWVNNPDSAVGMSIDDFTRQYSQSSNSDLAGLVPLNVQKSLRRTYGPGGRLVRIG